VRSSTTARRPAEPPSPSPCAPTFRIARSLFLRSLGLVYAIAFASLAVQVDVLFGEQGLWPMEEILSLARARAGDAVLWHYPSVFFLIGASEPIVVGAAWVGVGLGGLLVLGAAPRAVLVAAFALYLSFRSLGGAVSFLNYQWDALLLEAGLLAILLAPPGWRLDRSTGSPPSRVALGLFWFLLFRLFFASAWVRLASEDPTWRLDAPTALEYHFFTQPLPNPVAWYADALPDALLRLATQGMFVIEGIVPFFLIAGAIEPLAPRGPARGFLRAMRHAAAVAFACLMIGIGLTGNYGFFNLLTVALAILLVDDEAFAAILRRVPGGRRIAARAAWPREASSRSGSEAGASRSGEILAAVRLTGFLVAAVSLFFTATVVFGTQLDRSAGRSTALRPVYVAASRFGVASRYGLFARMTTERPELFLEGSDDGRTWHRYGFRYKPGDPNRRPPWAGFHMPRVDWQLWFAALEEDVEVGRRDGTVWIRRLFLRILEDSPVVDALFAEDPFPDEPPRYLRMIVADARFTTPSERRRTGAWWHFEDFRVFHEPVGLEGAPGE